ncbi:MAG: nucleotidyltransferase family protein [Nostoc sp. ChiSLP01]|nr:nucleotidyltransferase family protein [Nostoc sp. CmiSLP01]MDZ8288005.1 nucleotidyltransferase family protein [Nostoc sp. ChiSLP01]
METIILAGGLGSRLKDITATLPKPMAPVGSRPFLELLLDYLVSQGVCRVILSVGYKHEKILSYFGDRYKHCELVYSIETELLGTGGAIKYALNLAQSEYVFIMNGDTIFQISLSQMMSFHYDRQSDLTLALKPMNNFDRYGNVILSDTKIVKFEEKKFKSHGNINGGIYLLNKNLFDCFFLPNKFSFESEFMEVNCNKIKMHGFISNEYFIDIGIPKDYARIQLDFNNGIFSIVSNK